MKVLISEVVRPSSMGPHLQTHCKVTSVRRSLVFSNTLHICNTERCNSFIAYWTTLVFKPHCAMKCTQQTILLTLAFAKYDYDWNDLNNFNDTTYCLHAYYQGEALKRCILRKAYHGALTKRGKKYKRKHVVSTRRIVSAWVWMPKPIIRQRQPV